MDNTRGVMRRPTRAQPVATNVWAWRRDVALAILAWSAIVAAGLWLAGHVTRTLLIIAIAALLSYALTPLVATLRRAMPRWAAIAIVYVVLLVLLAGISSLVVSSLIPQVTDLATQISSALSPTQPGGSTPLYQSLLRLGLTAQQISAGGTWVTQQLASAAGGLAPFLTGALSAAFDILVVVVVSVYMLIDGNRLIRWLRTGLPLDQRDRGMFIADTIERVAGGYIRGQLVMCLAMGILVGLGLWVLGVPFAALLGVLAFFLEFIPFIGPPVAAAFAVLLAWPQGWLTIAVLLGWFVILHILEGYVLQPRLVGESVGLHPAVSILAVLAAGEVFGLWGALFAAPVAGIAQSFMEAVWRSWRIAHPDQFPATTAEDDAEEGTDVEAAEGADAEEEART